MELDLSPPAGLNVSLARSLLVNMLDRVAPEKLPPLHLTSRPVNTGMLLGDRLGLPWWRSVFTNIGDVIAPETLPPLELESRPVEVGELIGDQLAHGWWTSLLGGLRDTITTERQPALHLTAKPFDPGGFTGWLQLPCWSSVIKTPKVFLPDAPAQAASKPAASGTPVAATTPPPRPPRRDPELVLMERQLRHDLKLSRVRQAVWVSLIAAEALVLVFGFGWR